MASRALVLLGLVCGLLSAASCFEDHCFSGSCCPTGWTQFKSRCFFFHFDEQTWIQAEQKCLSLNGNLASIHSLEENSFIKTFIEKVTGFARVVWIGASDASSEVGWLWNDGSNFDYSRWNNGESHNLYGEHCLVTHWNVDYWNGADCSSRKSFVCSMNPNGTAPTPQPTLPPTIPPTLPPTPVYGY